MKGDHAECTEQVETPYSDWRRHRLSVAVAMPGGATAAAANADDRSGCGGRRAYERRWRPHSASVPEFVKIFPKASRTAGAWAEVRDLELSDQTGQLSAKEKALISLAVSAQIPCQYCIWFDTKAAGPPAPPTRRSPRRSRCRLSPGTGARYSTACRSTWPPQEGNGRRIAGRGLLCAAPLRPPRSRPKRRHVVRCDRGGSALDRPEAADHGQADRGELRPAAPGPAACADTTGLPTAGSCPRPASRRA